MGTVDYVIIAVIVLIVGSASAYIIKAKKSGQKCIGCPDANSCSSNKNASSGCSGCCSSCSGCNHQ